ncbi:MAG TPA: ribosomal protein S18-alanine N-acetyltransferase [Terriglobales bacterium]|nr:ribosomal protein S18-alanine N-acetyltransferase [Terriglobales bacterium]
MTEAVIRQATAQDLGALLELEQAAPTAAHWSRAHYAQILQGESPRRLCLLAEKGGLAGFVIAQISGPEWELENVVVQAASRRRGYGKLLLQALTDQARRQEATAILLEVRASNAPARALYESCGFKQMGLRRLYYREPEEDAIIYMYHIR